MRSPAGLPALVLRRLLRWRPPSGTVTPRGAVRISRRAAAKALAAAARRHPRVIGARVTLRRHPKGYLVRCTAEVAGVAGWRQVAAEVQRMLRDTLNQELYTDGEVYVSVLHGTPPPPRADWLQGRAGPSAPGAAAGGGAAGPERVASAPNPGLEGTRGGPPPRRGRGR
ncbi:MAG TPA: hypothetical protein VIO14_11500 [Dehalococcoidia bacterium]